MTTLLGDMLVRYRADISDLTSKVKQVKSDMSSVDDTAQKSGSSMFSSFKKGTQGILDFGSKVGMTIFGIKNLADTAVGLGEALLEPNASMEQTTVGFETLLGKGQKTQSFMKDLQNFADSTPFEFPELATNAEHMLAFGFTSKEVLPDLTAIGDAMSAMGKGSADIDSVVTVFGQMKAAGKVNAQDMMQLTSQGIPAWKMLADSMHLTVPEVQSLSQKGLLPADQAIKTLTGGMEKMFGGGMKAQAQTFNGQLSTLKDKAGEAMRSFTGPLFDMAKQGLGKLGDLVSSPGFQQFATTMGKDVADGLQKIGKFVGGVSDGIGKIVVWFQQGSAPAVTVGIALAAIAGGFAAIQIGAFIAAVPALVAGFIAWGVAAWSAAIATIAATWPLFLIGIAVVAVVAIIILVVKNWGAIAHWLQGVWKTVSSAIGGFFSGVGSVIHGVVDKIGGAFSGLGSTIHHIWDGIVGVVKGAINLIIGGINQFISFIDGIQIHIPAIGIGPIHTPAFDWNGVGIPHIPYLASGGIIQSTGLAFVHQGETVIPAKASSPGGNTGQEHTTIVELDGIQIARIVQSATDRLVRLKLGANGRAL